MSTRCQRGQHSRLILQELKAVGVVSLAREVGLGEVDDAARHELHVREVIHGHSVDEYAVLAAASGVQRNEPTVNTPPVELDIRPAPRAYLSLLSMTTGSPASSTPCSRTVQCRRLMYTGLSTMSHTPACRPMTCSGRENTRWSRSPTCCLKMRTKRPHGTGASPRAGLAAGMLEYGSSQLSGSLKVRGFCCWQVAEDIRSRFGGE